MDEPRRSGRKGRPVTSYDPSSSWGSSDNGRVGRPHRRKGASQSGARTEPKPACASSSDRPSSSPPHDMPRQKQSRLNFAATREPRPPAEDAPSSEEHPSQREDTQPEGSAPPQPGGSAAPQHEGSAAPLAAELVTSTEPPSDAVVRLQAAQKAHFPSILRELEAEEPSAFRKRSCWAWYVWPTEMEGMSDMNRTAVTGSTDAKWLLTFEPTRTQWVRILELLTEAVAAQRSWRPFPRIDQGRIGYFIKTWELARFADAARLFPDFERALQKFNAVMLEFVETSNDSQCRRLFAT